MPPISDSTIKLSAVALAIANSFTPSVSLAATINVDGTNCTLIEAINSANTDSNVGSPGCVAGSGADVINLQVNRSYSAEYADFTALPTITSAVTINGNGRTVSRSGGDDIRLLKMSNAAVEINNLTLSGGNAYDSGGAMLVSNSSVTLNNSTIRNSYSFYEGGGIFCEGASSLSLNNTTITNNESVYQGGAIYASLCHVAMTSSTLSLNKAYEAGAVYLKNASLTISNTSMTQNAALYDYSYGGGTTRYGGNGGALLVVGAVGNVEINNSTFTNNSAYQYGGGIYLNASNATINASTFSGNQNNLDPSGDAYGFSSGGALFAFDTEGSRNLTITNSTLTDNTSGNSAGAVGTEGLNSVSITNSTITNNLAYAKGALYLMTDGDVTLSGVQVNANIADTGAGIFIDSITSGSVSIDRTSIFNNTATNNAGGVYVTGNPGLATLNISNSTISGNSATNNNGGGVFLTSNVSNVSILNSSIVDNVAGTSGASLYTSGGHTALLLGNNLFNSTTGIECFFAASAALTTTFTNNWFDDSSCDGIASGPAPISALTQLATRAYGHSPEDITLSAGGDITLCAAPPVNGVDQTGTTRGSETCSIGAIEASGSDDFFILRAQNGNVIVVPL